LPELRGFSIIVGRGWRMKDRVGRLAYQALGRIFVLIAAIALIPPVTPSVLCIAPGSHVAIEELDAGCCASPDVFRHMHGQVEDALGATGACRDCIDYLISPTVSGPIPESPLDVHRILAAECVSLYLPIPSSCMPLEDAPTGIAASAPHDFAGPLRC
jgi:hypothetical protein